MSARGLRGRRVRGGQSKRHGAGLANVAPMAVRRSLQCGVKQPTLTWREGGNAWWPSDRDIVSEECARISTQERCFCGTPGACSSGECASTPREGPSSRFVGILPPPWRSRRVLVSRPLAEREAQLRAAQRATWVCPRVKRTAKAGRCPAFARPCMPADGMVRVWDSRSGSCVLERTGHTEPILDLALSPDGARCITAADDGTSRVFSLVP